MKFSDIVGHHEVIERLRNMIDTDHLPHAILLSGPSGIGKMNVARALLQYVYCRNRKDGDSCGVCPACLQNASLNNPDVHFSYPIVKSTSPKVSLSSDRLTEWKQMLENHPLMSPQDWNNVLGAGNSSPIIHVDEAAEISRLAMLSPVVNDLKTFVIWQPEKLHASAANKLLKLIEEPLGASLFILVSNNPGQILPTIFSRTQRVNLHPLSDEEVLEWLRTKSDQPMRELEEYAHIAEGNLLKAQNYLENNDERTELSDYFIRMMRSAYARNIVDLKNLSEIFYSFGRDKGIRFLQHCAKMIRENFIYNLRNRDLNTMFSEEEEFSKRFSPFVNEKNVEKITEAINEAANDIARNANGKIVFFDFLLLVSRYIRTSR